MSGQCVEKIACTNPSCGSSDGMQVYQENGKYSGYCYVCTHYEPNPYGDNPREPQPMTGTSHLSDTNQRIMSVHNYNFSTLEDRGIAGYVAQYFGVKGDHYKQKHYYPYYKDNEFRGYKERTISSKEFYAIGDLKRVDLFGELQAIASKSHRLIITEGECDCMAAFQMLWEYQQKSAEYKDQVPAVVSLAHGAAAAFKDLGDKDGLFERFKEIILCFDKDKAGDEAIAEAVRILPLGKTRIAKLSEKDANDMLKKGKGKEFCKEILFTAKPYRPTTVRSVSEAFEAASRVAQMGLSLPWSTLTRLTQGVNPGDIVGVGAGVGIGKTSVWHRFMSHHITVNKQRVGGCFLEEDIGDTLKNLATFEARKRFVSADGNYTQEELAQAVLKLDGSVFLYEHDYQAQRDIHPWEAVKATIRHMVLVEGCQHIVVDPLTALVAQMTSSEANDALNSIMAEASALAKTLNFTFYYGAHLNPPKTGLPHEEGGRVFLSQFTGSRAMIKWSHIIFGLERNTQADDPRERNTTCVRLLKARKLGVLDKFYVYYDNQTGAFEETAPPGESNYTLGPKNPVMSPQPEIQTCQNTPYTTGIAVPTLQPLPPQT